MVAASAVLIKERHIVEAFVRAGATASSSARTPQELSIDIHRAAWRLLCRRAILREAAAGRFYLDRDAWEALRRTRHRLALAVLVIIIAVILAAIALGRVTLY